MANTPFSFFAVLLIAVFHIAAAAVGPDPAAANFRDPRVTLSDERDSYILSNGYVTAAINKSNATFSLKYKELDVVNRGYWSQVGGSTAGEINSFGERHAASIALNPSQNNGTRAVVLLSFTYDGKGLPCDVDIYYSLGRGERGLYATAVWRHQADYPAFSVGEARMAAKLPGSIFDYLAIDDRRHGQLPSGADWDKGQQLNMKEVRRITTGPFAGRVEHKYDYSAVMADTPAYGWISTRHNVGVFLINPSMEYIAGGPTKVELNAHLDVNPGGAPTLLNMFHGSHYGGSSLVVAENESWSKVIGPFLIYCNDGYTPDSIFADAIAKAKVERQLWPYPWFNDKSYPMAAQRGVVAGRILIHDPLAPGLDVHNMQVGLASPEYTVENARGKSVVNWQRDSKHYQFWTRADLNGQFIIRNVRPGKYELYAFADGVLGEFSKADIIVTAGKPLNLGRLTWTPMRYGQQLWDIGIPNRSAEEFRHGNDYWHWGLYFQYPKEFPDDVNFIIGKSDFHKDWNYAQPPHMDGDRVKSTTWRITFNLPRAVGGAAILRLAICGYRGPAGINVAVNDKPAGGTGPMPDSGVMHRDGIRGYWYERDVAFDGSMLHAGINVISLTPRAKAWPDGVLYDYIRLELNEAGKAADFHPDNGPAVPEHEGPEHPDIED